MANGMAKKNATQGGAPVKKYLPALRIGQAPIINIDK